MSLYKGMYGVCMFVEVGEIAGLAYDANIGRLSNRSDITGKSVLLGGLFQSWKYTLGVQTALRYHLRLLPNVSAAVHAYLDRIRKPAWKVGACGIVLADRYYYCAFIERLLVDCRFSNLLLMHVQNSIFSIGLCVGVWMCVFGFILRFFYFCLWTEYKITFVSVRACVRASVRSK